jgi:hypothetical protein
MWFDLAQLAPAELDARNEASAAGTEVGSHVRVVDSQHALAER